MTELSHAHGDFETRSPVDLKKAGVHVYAEHPETKPWCFSWAIGDEPVETWRPERPGNIARLFAHIEAGGVFEAWNAAFELAIWNGIMVPRYGWPPLAIAQTRCVMVKALAMGLPGGLDHCAEAIRHPVRKDLEGGALMKRMMKPLKVFKAGDKCPVCKAKDTKCKTCRGLKSKMPGCADCGGTGVHSMFDCDACDGFGTNAETSYVWETDPAKIDRLVAYCEQDVEAERSLSPKLLPLSPQEQRVWTLDQVINNRGVLIDLRSVESALKVIEAATAKLDAEMARATGGAVKTCSQVAAIKGFLSARLGFPVTGLAKADLAELLGHNLVADVENAIMFGDSPIEPADTEDAAAACRRVLELRQLAAKASTAKLKAMWLCTNADGRARGLHQYWGAHTGRWGGRRIQTQNLPRTYMHQDEIDDVINLLYEAIDDAHRAALVDTLDLLYGAPLSIISETLRGMLMASPGKILRVADFSSVEARGVAWLAGAEKILDVFRTGADIYCVAAEDIYGHPCNKKDHPFERSVGKVVILACGYQGAVGAFQAMARGYNVVVSDIQAAKIVKAWRAKNPEIVQYWAAVEKAAISAVQDPKHGVYYAGPPGREVRFAVRGSFLRCRLPSGRFITYPFPRIVDYIWIRKGRRVSAAALAAIANEAEGLETEAVVPEEDAAEDAYQSKRVPAAELNRWLARGWEQNGEPGPALHYRYQDDRKNWVEGPTYGGSLVENITQGMCRDMLAESMLRLEDHGYTVVMSVHDEAVAETLEAFGSTKEMESLMSVLPSWAPGFPLDADGFSRVRYKK